MQSVRLLSLRERVKNSSMSSSRASTGGDDEYSCRPPDFAPISEARSGAPNALSSRGAASTRTGVSASSSRRYVPEPHRCSARGQSLAPERTQHVPDERNRCASAGSGSFSPRSERSTRGGEREAVSSSPALAAAAPPPSWWRIDETSLDPSVS